MKKGFRPTPNQFKNSMRIMSGSKTNASLRDIEEDDKELEEKEGIIVSIEKNKINGDGWTVKDDDGKTYKCSCQSNLYEIPESKERGGLLYPNNTVKCKFKINPVLRINTITEIIGDKKTQEKIDINKWKHENQDTTVIAKPNSAISISNGAITFNYDNKNKITIDKDKTNIKGNLNLPESTTVNGKPIKTEDLDKALQNLPIKIKTSTYDYVNGKATETSAQATIQKAKMDIFSQERVIDDMLDQKQTPQETLKFPTTTYKADDEGEQTSSNKDTSQGHVDTKTEDPRIDELKIYPNGVVTIRGEADGKRKVYCTQTWITSYEKNTITVTISRYCDYCEYIDGDTVTYIDYCPTCNAWHILYEKNGYIKCQQCGAIYCGSCGHNEDNNGQNLKKYEDNYIIGNGLNCEYCQNILEPEISKEYVDYCPNCGQWKVLQIDTIENDLSISNQIYCTNCNTHYCLVCGTSQLGYKKESFHDKIQYYDNYIEKMKKILFIKEN